MKTEMFLVICFLVGVLVFYLLKQSCGCSAVVEGQECVDNINILKGCSDDISNHECYTRGNVAVPAPPGYENKLDLSQRHWCSNIHSDDDADHNICNRSGHLTHIPGVIQMCEYNDYDGCTHKEHGQCSLPSKTGCCTR